MFPEDISKLILSFVPIENAEYQQFKTKTILAIEKSRKLKFERFTVNLRYDANGLYSHNTKVAHFNLDEKTIQKLGWWSKTTSRHYNWCHKYFKNNFDFKEIF